MKLAIMQPYLLPYLGYFQLATKVNHFVFLDDVNFIKKGYINRNNILSNGNTYRFTIPIIKASQNKLINEHSFQTDIRSFFKTIEFNYSTSPYYSDVLILLKSILIQEDLNVAKICSQSIIKVLSYLGEEIDFSFSSEISNTEKSQKRILHICKKLKATEYYNPIGGVNLYDHNNFQQEGINLIFFKGEFPEYKHLSRFPVDKYIPQLSIIDILMSNSKKDIRAMLKMGKEI